MDAPIPSKHLQSLAFTIVFFEVENCFEFSLQEKTKKLNKTNTNRCLIIADNGKSICEGRAKLDEKFNFDRTKQIAFSDYQITKKSNMKSKLRLKATGSSIINSTPPFANTMLSVVSFYIVFSLLKNSIIFLSFISD